MTVQIVEVPREHWGILRKVADGIAPPAESSVALLAIKEKRPVARILLVQPAHIEGIWIEPSMRGGMVMQRMVERIEDEARKRGIRSLFAFGSDAEMEGYIERLGYEKQPYTVWRRQLGPCL